MCVRSAEIRRPYDTRQQYQTKFLPSSVGGETETSRQFTQSIQSPPDFMPPAGRDGGTRRSSDEEAAAETRQAHLAVPSTIRSTVSRSGLAGHAYRHVIIYGPSCSRAYQEPCILIITSIDDIFTYIHINFSKRLT